MTKRGAAVAAAGTLMLLLSGCGSNTESSAKPAAQQSDVASSSPSPSVTPDASYGTVVQLKDAAVLAGYVCKNWRQDDVVKLAAQSGHCSGADVFATFASEGDLQAQLDTFREIDAMFNDEPTPRLVGPNWVINAPEAASLQNALGGTVETG